MKIEIEKEKSIKATTTTKKKKKKMNEILMFLNILLLSFHSCNVESIILVGYFFATGMCVSQFTP